ncbi:unnamed protein product [Peniophora sp. CBMAI 1063]|nr:unnamed protein product [Peniophora sp. CBMAI 1063]
MSEYSYSSRDSSRSRSKAHHHGGGPAHSPGGAPFYASGGYAASTTSFNSVQQQGVGGAPYTTTSPHVTPSAVPSPRIDTNVQQHNPYPTTHIQRDSTTSFGSSIDGRSTYSSSPTSYSPSPHTPYNSSPLNPNRAPPMVRANTDVPGMRRQEDGSYYVDRSDDDERSQRRARRKEEKPRRSRSHSDVRSAYSNSDAGSTYSAHIPPVPAVPAQYVSGSHASISSSNFGEPETPRAQAFSALEGRNPHASSHHKKSTRAGSRKERDGDGESRYGGGSDAGSLRSHKSSGSKRAKSVASSTRSRAPPSIAGSHHAPSVAGSQYAASQYALQPYVAPVQHLTAGQTPVPPPPPPGSNYSYGQLSPSVHHAQLAAAQQQFSQAQQAANAASSAYHLAYTHQVGVSQTPGSNTTNVGTNVNYFINANSPEDAIKIGKELRKLDKQESKSAASLFKNVLLKTFDK